MKHNYTANLPIPQTAERPGCKFALTATVFFIAVALWTVGYFAYNLIFKA